MDLDELEENEYGVIGGDNNDSSIQNGYAEGGVNHYEEFHTTFKDKKSSKKSHSKKFESNSLNRSTETKIDQRNLKDSNGIKKLSKVPLKDNGKVDENLTGQQKHKEKYYDDEVSLNCTKQDNDSSFIRF